MFEIKEVAQVEATGWGSWAASAAIAAPILWKVVPIIWAC